MRLFRCHRFGSRSRCLDSSGNGCCWLCNWFRGSGLSNCRFSRRRGRLFCCHWLSRCCRSLSKSTPFCETAVGLTTEVGFGSALAVVVGLSAGSGLPLPPDPEFGDEAPKPLPFPVVGSVPFRLPSWFHASIFEDRFLAASSATSDLVITTPLFGSMRKRLSFISKKKTN